MRWYFEGSGEEFVNNLGLGTRQTGEAILVGEEGGVGAVGVETVLYEDGTFATRSDAVAENAVEVDGRILG